MNENHPYAYGTEQQNWEIYSNNKVLQGFSWGKSSSNFLLFHHSSVFWSNCLEWIHLPANFSSSGKVKWVSDLIRPSGWVSWSPPSGIITTPTRPYETVCFTKVSLITCHTGWHRRPFLNRIASETYLNRLPASWSLPLLLHCVLLLLIILSETHCLR
jgi:hypothetical protein